MEGKFDDITDTDKIQSTKSYIQSANEHYKLLLKEDLPEFFLNSKLPKDARGDKSILHRQVFMGTMLLSHQCINFIWLIIGVLRGLCLSPPKIVIKNSFISRFTCKFLQHMLLVNYWSFYPFLYPMVDTMQATTF